MQTCYFYRVNIKRVPLYKNNFVEAPPPPSLFLVFFAIMDKGARSNDVINFPGRLLLEIEKDFRTPETQVRYAGNGPPSDGHVVPFTHSCGADKDSVSLPRQFQQCSTQLGWARNFLFDGHAIGEISPLYVKCILYAAYASKAGDAAVPFKLWCSTVCPLWLRGRSLDFMAPARKERVAKGVLKKSTKRKATSCVSGVHEESDTGSSVECPAKKFRRAEVLLAGRSPVCGSCALRISSPRTTDTGARGFKVGTACRSLPPEIKGHIQKELSDTTVLHLVGSNFTDVSPVDADHFLRVKAVMELNASVVRGDYMLYIFSILPASTANTAMGFAYAVFPDRKDRRAATLYLISRKLPSAPQRLSVLCRDKLKMYGFAKDGWTETAPYFKTPSVALDDVYVPNVSTILGSGAINSGGSSGRHALAAFDDGGDFGRPRIVSVHLLLAVKAIRAGQRICIKLVPRTTNARSMVVYSPASKTSRAMLQCHALYEVPSTLEKPFPMIENGEFLQFSTLLAHVKLRAKMEGGLPEKDRSPIIISACLQDAVETVPWTMSGFSDSPVTFRFGAVLSALVRVAIRCPNGPVSYELGPECSFLETKPGSRKEALAMSAVEFVRKFKDGDSGPLTYFESLLIS